MKTEGTITKIANTNGEKRNLFHGIFSIDTDDGAIVVLRIDNAENGQWSLINNGVPKEGITDEIIKIMTDKLMR